MDMIPKWLSTTCAIIMGLGAILLGSGYLAKGSDLSAMDAKNQATFAQSSDLQTLKSDTNKRLDDMQVQMDKRFDRLEGDIKDLQTLILTNGQRYDSRRDK